MQHLIKSLAVSERPYEKAQRKGIASLSDAELLAVILRTGTKDESALDLANHVLDAHLIHKGILGLCSLSREDLCMVRGIGNIKATQLLAVAELSKRINHSLYKNEIVFDNPGKIADYYMNKCKFLKREHTFLMLFSNTHMLLDDIQISEGTVNASLISPREILIEAVKREAVNMILVHNHPSGNPEPSKADIQITKRIYDAGELMDIHLSDHIIIGNGNYVSLLERGYIK
ncbi:MAG: DNA repair protein RadC [Eubacteriales bacterium]|nr:DNA repair protein RadC [Lachnospiraceae bacterium]MDO5127709.1 DNA repair protein RadC [Eubacteriales bacterium]